MRSSKLFSLTSFIAVTLIMSIFLVAGCGVTNSGTQNTAPGESKVVNLYTDRHYDTDRQLYDLFEKETGIKVNMVEGKSDELIERLAREGLDTEADLLITADAGRLHRAKEQGLLQAVTSAVLEKNIPENLRDPENYWFGLTKRARVIVYAKDRANPDEISSYADLTDPKLKGKILVRTSSHVYNQSLLASFIVLEGEEKARAWAAGIVKNMARPPQGNDRDQVKAIAAGIGDIAIMNSYYLGQMLNSSDPEEIKAAQQVGIIFPDQKGNGTHINVSGIGLTKYAKNKENAIKFMEFLSSEKAQKVFADANYEYPVNPAVEPSDLLKSWGDFKSQNIKLSRLGELNSRAVKIFDEVGWQ
ncbi:Fe(3+) ABC transporter substrate-binding protein [Thermosediminibacter litoriperuensis]|uniref:Iron(III) transport system substrate-binding protein n=1 Tax=Thermosediminibacter litoriperuensis TaxID=291989 RepID=A0A5S5AG65_9FIRM|nr:Fe(3+) ABC transporter substrate-binding protein [Thermosediminibacter litoriperuensis]TYP49252.1 iron(III) transport system substrate-binding protein [Thermosediminibacter litoriperuensis]